MQDHGRLIIHLERVTVRGRFMYRGWDPERLWVLGYGTSLNVAAEHYGSRVTRERTTRDSALS